MPILIQAILGMVDWYWKELWTYREPVGAPDTNTLITVGIEII